MDRQIYIVSGSHPHPSYQLIGARFEVNYQPYDKKYYATNAKLGYGKDYDTAERAIRALCNDHAITVISIDKL